MIVDEAVFGKVKGDRLGPRHVGAEPWLDLVEHLRQDAPEIYTFLSVGMSAYVASKLSSNPNAPVIGGFLGAFLAMSSVEQARKDNAARYRPPVLRIRRR